MAVFIYFLAQIALGFFLAFGNTLLLQQARTLSKGENLFTVTGGDGPLGMFICETRDSLMSPFSAIIHCDFLDVIFTTIKNTLSYTLFSLTHTTNFVLAPILICMLAGILLYTQKKYPKISKEKKGLLYVCMITCSSSLIGVIVYLF